MMFKFTTIKPNNDDNRCFTQPKSQMECPTCNEKAKSVLAKTFQALVKEKIVQKFSCYDGFYYCKTPSCKTIYFRDETILSQEDINITVGLKNGAIPATVCYCFKWTKEKIKTELEESGRTVALKDIKEKMENLGCSCETLNPSGGCCLADTTKAIKEIESELRLN